MHELATHIVSFEKNEEGKIFFKLLPQIGFVEEMKSPKAENQCPKSSKI